MALSEEFITVFTCVIAGIGAGVGTGFAGLSAAAFIGPLLIGIVGIPAYQATGIGLASDVLASAVSAWTYHRAGNLDMKNGKKLLIMVLIGTLAGSIAAGGVENNALGILSIGGSLVLGVQQLQTAIRGKENKMVLPLPDTPAWRRAERIIGGLVIGFICGFMGTGGGMMMLIVLTVVMGYELRIAVGTSVFIMTFTALFGSSLHFAIKGTPDLGILVLCAAVTFIAAWLSAKLANHLKPIVARGVVGALLVGMGILMLVFKLLGLS